jgi:hypothetical protein
MFVSLATALWRADRMTVLTHASTGRKRGDHPARVYPISNCDRGLKVAEPSSFNSCNAQPYS